MVTFKNKKYNMMQNKNHGCNAVVFNKQRSLRNSKKNYSTTNTCLNLLNPVAASHTSSFAKRIL